jgi:hypothetical protein
MGGGLFEPDRTRNTQAAAINIATPNCAAGNHVPNWILYWLPKVTIDYGGWVTYGRCQEVQRAKQRADLRRNIQFAVIKKIMGVLFALTSKGEPG